VALKGVVVLVVVFVGIVSVAFSIIGVAVVVVGVFSIDEIREVKEIDIRRARRKAPIQLRQLGMAIMSSLSPQLQRTCVRIIEIQPICWVFC
jgi:hypothetical protein